jgi:hypothetical protein
MPEYGLREWAFLIATVALAGVLAWCFWSYLKRNALVVAPEAEALTYPELRAALRIVEDQGGSIIHDEAEYPIGEAAAYRATNEGWIRSRQTGGPWSTTAVIELTDEGRKFLHIRSRPS